MSCTSPKANIKPLISEDTLKIILYELSFLDAHFSDLNSSIKDSLVQENLNKKLLQYQLTPDQFKQAMNQYMQDDDRHVKLEQELFKMLRDSTVY